MSGWTRRSATSRASASSATGAGPGLRRLVAGRQRQGAVPLHRQGHRLLPLAVLAGGAARLGLPHADGGVRHGFLTVNGEKMSKSRGTFIRARSWLEHLDPERCATTSPPSSGRVRGHRPQPRGLRSAGQLRPGRQAGQYRQPLRGLHSPRGGRTAGRGIARARAARGDRRGRRGTRRALRAAPLRPGHPPAHGAGGPGQPVHRPREALADGARSRPRG
jgi:hypothetical protein